MLWILKVDHVILVGDIVGRGGKITSALLYVFDSLVFSFSFFPFPFPFLFLAFDLLGIVMILVSYDIYNITLSSVYCIYPFPYWGKIYYIVERDTL